jgi:hypothetical protein
VSCQHQLGLHGTSNYTADKTSHYSAVCNLIIYYRVKKTSCGFYAVNIRTQITHYPLQLALLCRSISKEQVTPNQLTASKREVRFGKAMKIDKKHDYVNYSYQSRFNLFV